MARVPGFSQALDYGDAGHLTPGLSLPPVALPAIDGRSVDLAAVQREQRHHRLSLDRPPRLSQSARLGSNPGRAWFDAELEGFRDRHADFTETNLQLFGLSGQETAYQRELVMRLGLPFPILSDAEGAFSAALELPNFVTGGTTYLKRLTLLIAGGRIETLFYPVIEPAGHAAEVLREVRAVPKR